MRPYAHTPHQDRMRLRNNFEIKDRRWFAMYLAPVTRIFCRPYRPGKKTFRKVR